MKTTTLIPTLRLAALGALAVLTIGQPVLRAADHRDGPTNAHDSATDLNDAYFFEDPVDATKLVVIATFHGFIVPGEAGNEAIFAPEVNYRFEFYNNHVNTPLPVDPGPAATRAEKAAFKRAQSQFLASIKPARTIDVSFTGRTAIAGPTGKEALQIPQAQTANLVFTGFKGQVGFLGSARKDKASGLAVLNPGLGGTSPMRTVVDVPTFTGAPSSTGIKFFAGETDDPFFFDIPAFGRTVGGIRDGTLPADFLTNPLFFGRARDTFAGYNTLAIALSIPKAALANADVTKTRIGLNVIAQRRGVEINVKRGATAGTRRGAGGFVAVDREGNPAINVAFVPFNRKSEYNSSTPKDDASGKFAGDIVASITALNPGVTTIGALAGIAVFSGDLLTLDTAAAAGWPNGRKLDDDVIDTALSVLFSPTVVKDNVDVNDVPFEAAFPYLGLTQQPRANAAPDDNTRN
ncbi:MAG: DUF4331 family protein [Chthoniobacteraceae bacterium]